MSETAERPVPATVDDAVESRDLPAGVTDADVERMNRYLQNGGKRESTIRVYRSHWRTFVKWCHGRDLAPMPTTPGDLVNYLTHRADNVGLKTVQNDVAAVRWMHRQLDKDDPTASTVVQNAMESIAQEKRGESTTKKKAVLTKHIRAMVEAVRTEEPSAGAGRVARNRWLRGLRDAALLLVGYAGAFRRAELAGVHVRHVAFNEKGMEIHLPETKTDEKDKGINYMRNPDFCPVRALQTWMEEAGITGGPIFRAVPRTQKMKGDNQAEPITGKAVANVVKRAAEDVDGLDPDEVAGHSLRRGHITQGALNGASVDRLMKQAGHVDPRTTTEYVEDAKRMETNTSQDLGL